MRSGLLIAIFLFVVTATSAQTVPDGSPATRWATEYMRSPSLGIDPFRHAMIPHWGFVISVGALAENNSLNVADAAAIRFIEENDELTLGDAIDIIGLIPRGSGLNALAQAEGGVHFGGPIGPITLGFSAGGRGVGTLELDDQLVTILREGNAGRQTFGSGRSRGAAITTADFGVHAVLRLGMLGPGGPQLSLGAGARSVRPLLYASGGSTNGESFLSITSDSISSHIEIQSLSTPTLDGGGVSSYLKRGSGVVGDFLARLDLPESGMAFEAMLVGVGAVDINGVERRTASIDIQEPSIDDVVDVLFDPDTLSFDVRDTIDISVSVPRYLRFAASAWANSVLQLDISTTAPLSSEFKSPPWVEAGATFRFIRVLPLRVGLIMGGQQGTGFTGGVGVEGRRFLLRFAGASLGGLFSGARGTAARFELGVFF